MNTGFYLRPFPCPPSPPPRRQKGGVRGGLGKREKKSGKICRRHEKRGKRIRKKLNWEGGGARASALELEYISSACHTIYVRSLYAEHKKCAQKMNEAAQTYSFVQEMN